jgi:hypothetical protein
MPRVWHLQRDILLLHFLGVVFFEVSQVLTKARTVTAWEVGVGCDVEKSWFSRGFLGKYWGYAVCSPLFERCGSVCNSDCLAIIS